MIDASIINNILSCARKMHIHCDLIDQQIANKLIEDIAKKYQFNLSVRYIWESVSINKMQEYDGDISKWKSFLIDFLENFHDNIYFVVTDDEFYPWSVFLCEKNKILEILDQQQYFEYFVFDNTMEHVLFDTHDNKLLFI